MDHSAHWGLDGEGHSIRNGVVHMDKLHRELACLDHISCLTGNHLGLRYQTVLLQLQLDQPGTHPGGIDGRIDRTQHIGDGPNVVFVPVGDKDAPDLALVLDEIAYVRDDHIDAIHIIIREPHAAVHNNDVVAVLVDCQVLADLIQTAQRDDFQFFSHKIFVTSFLIVTS